MRSRTSRGVPEWSGGKELYIGSAVSATGTSFRVIGIVPGPLKGSRGSTRWGHPSRRAPWAEVGKGDQPLVGWCAPQGPPPAPRVGTLGWGGRPHTLGGTPPPWPPPPWEIQSPRAGAPPGGLYKGGRGGGQPHPLPWRLPLPLQHLLLLHRARRSPAGVLQLHHHHAVVLLLEPSSSTSPLPCWIKKKETLR